MLCSAGDSVHLLMVVRYHQHVDLEHHAISTAQIVKEIYCNYSLNIFLFQECYVNRQYKHNTGREKQSTPPGRISSGDVNTCEGTFPHRATAPR